MSIVVDIFEPISPEQAKKAFLDFMAHIYDTTYASEKTGQLYCKNCNAMITIDWFEREADCPCGNV